MIQTSLVFVTFLAFCSAAFLRNAPDLDTWYGPTVYYVIDSSASSFEIPEAMAHIEERTVIRFKPKTASQTDYMFFYDHGSVCRASGKHKQGQATIHLKATCSEIVIVHEILHSLGFIHEHQRDDRDSFLDVLWDNIAPKMFNQYTIRDEPEDTFYSDYDYLSVMHYDSPTFARAEEQDIRSGFDIVRVFQPIGNATHAFVWLYQGGRAEIYELQSTRDLGSRIYRSNNWGSGYVDAEIFNFNGRTYLAMLRSDPGRLRIWELESNGDLGDRVYSDTSFTDGFDFVEVYDDVMLFVNRGLVRTNRIEFNAVDDSLTLRGIGPPETRLSTSVDWDHVFAFKLGSGPSSTYHLLVSGSDSIVNWIHIHELGTDGSVEDFSDIDHSIPWGDRRNMEVFYASGDPYLFVLEDSGQWETYELVPEPELRHEFNFEEVPQYFYDHFPADEEYECCDGMTLPTLPAEQHYNQVSIVGEYCFAYRPDTGYVRMVPVESADGSFKEPREYDETMDQLIPSNPAMGDATEMSPDDIRAVNEIMRGNLHIHQLPDAPHTPMWAVPNYWPTVEFGLKTECRRWSAGWTHVKFFSPTNDDHFVILYKENDDGISKTYRMNHDGSIGSKVDEHDWTSDFNIMETYKVGSNWYLFFYRDYDGLYKIYELDDNGDADKLEEGNIETGYTHALFYSVETFPQKRAFNYHVFFYNTFEGEVDYYHVEADGELGDHFAEGNSWSKYYSEFEVFLQNGQLYMFVYSFDSGKAKVFEINAQGRVGSKVYDKTWSTGYSELLVYQYATKTRLFLLNRASGIAKFAHILDGKPSSATFQTDSGWDDRWRAAAIWQRPQIVDGGTTYPPMAHLLLLGRTEWSG